MGLLGKIRGKANYQRKKANTPEGMVLYHGRYVHLYTDEAGLPENFEDLKDMSKYYRYGDCQDPKKEEIYGAVIRKMYGLIQAGQGEDPNGEITETYFTIAAPQEEIDRWQFRKFCGAIDEFYLTEGALKDGRKKLCDLNLFYGSEIQKSFPYFERHLPELIESVCILLNKEKRPASLLHVGYYLYQDLLAWCGDPDPCKVFSFRHPRFDPNYLWKQTMQYLKAADAYYGYLIQNPGKQYESRAQSLRAALTPMDTEALYHAQDCSKEALTEVYQRFTVNAAETADHCEEGVRLLASYKNEAEKLEALSMLRRAADGGSLQARKTLLEFLAGDNDLSAQVELAKDLYHGTKIAARDTEAAYSLFAKAADAGSGEALYYLGRYYEDGEKPVAKDLGRAEDYFEKSREMGFLDAYRRLADLEFGRNNKAVAAEYYKTVLPTLSAKDDPKLVKRTIARIIAGYPTGDVNEHTLALYALAADYARLDAPIVKEADLLALLADAEKGEYQAMDELVYYYQEYSRGPRLYGTIPGSEIYNTDQPRAWEMEQIAGVFRLMKIAMLLKKANEDPEQYLDELAQAYLDQGNAQKAGYYAELGIRLDIPAMLHFAYHNAKKLGYEDEEAMQYLRRAAGMGYRRSIDALEHLAELEEGDRQRAAWVEEHKPKPKTRSDYALELELLERDIDMMLGGSGHSLEENALLGKISFADTALLRHYKNKFLDRHS